MAGNARQNTASKNAQFGARQTYVEVFLNDQYQGLYGLMEQVDRKQLGVAKMEGDTVRGQIYKANASDVATSFKESPLFKNALPNWAGFQMKYPYEDYTSHWDDLAAFVRFVSKSTTEDFVAEIGKRLDLENAIDYYIFMNLLHATDNWTKNYFLARQSEATPYYFVPWDLDGVMGNFGDGMRISGTNKVFSNNLFDRLLAEDPQNFKARLKQRWKDLQSSTLSYETISSRIKVYYTTLNENDLYQREQSTWQQGRSPEEELEFITTWLLNRITYLNGYFESLN